MDLAVGFEGFSNFGGIKAPSEGTWELEGSHFDIRALSVDNQWAGSSYNLASKLLAVIWILSFELR